MEKQKKSVGTTLLVVLLLIVTIAALVLATFAWARYTSSTTGTATANVAKWNVSANVANESQWSQVYTHVVDQRLAPGTSGVIPVTINANATEVCTRYEVYLVSAAGNTPVNLKFYQATESNGTYTKTGTGVGATAINNSKLIDGYLNFNGTANASVSGHTHTETTATEYIYWEWPYQTGTVADDEQDTNDGINAVTNPTLTLTIKVVATQVDPTTGLTE